MQIKDIQIEFEGTSLSKFGLFGLLVWFLLDIIELDKRFKEISVKRKRNRSVSIKRRKSAFSAHKLCLGIVVTSLLGIKRFENIKPLLHTENKIANLIGLEKFFSVSTVRDFINGFQLWHLRQLDQINFELLKDFGECTRQDFPIVDIDSQTHTLESRKREGAVVGYNKKKPGKPCYQWSMVFVRGEAIGQKLLAGDKKDSEEIIGRIKELRNKLSQEYFIIRVDGGYFSGEFLNFIYEENLGLVTCTRYDWVVAQPDNKPDEHQWIRYDDKTRLYDLGLTKVVSTSKYKFRVILVEKEQESFTKKRNKILRYAVVAHLLMNMRADALYEFYHQRQTIENFFKEAEYPFNAGKMPSQLFRANEAYLYLVTIAYNCFHIFKKSICQATGEEILLRHLEIR